MCKYCDIKSNHVYKGNYGGDEFVEQLVNKDEFIAKANAWVKNCFTGPFGEGMADNIANEFEKYMRSKL